ncbi:hypothetical protein KKC91_12875 [bacterium]|nr:hypothetical protein [bacterium]
MERRTRHRRLVYAIAMVLLLSCTVDPDDNTTYDTDVVSTDGRNDPTTIDTASEVSEETGTLDADAGVVSDVAETSAEDGTDGNEDTSSEDITDGGDTEQPDSNDDAQVPDGEGADLSDADVAPDSTDDT